MPVYFKKNVIVSITLCLTAFFLVASSPITLTESAYQETKKVSLKAQADTMKPPSSLKVTNTRVGETDLSWVPSTSTYVTGYVIYRSEKISGPWEKIASINGRTSSKYTDTSSGARSWIYKVEAVRSSWSAATFPIEAPPAVGRSFFDTFDGPPGNLDKRVTEDGKSIWIVWSGNMTTADVNPNKIEGAPNGFGAYGTLGSPTTTPSPGNGDVAVVRTPVNSGWVYAEDFDGYERVVLRGKDPQNYIYAGGGTTTNSDGSTKLIPASFEIAEIKNGVKTVLAAVDPKATPIIDKDFRVEIKDNTIKAFIDATRNDPKSGRLILSAETSFLQGDPLATYFGIGFTRGGMGINDFTFEAY